MNEARVEDYSKTQYITFYLRDGGYITYDLTDPKIPLPRFRSLVSWRKDEGGKMKPTQISRITIEEAKLIEYVMSVIERGGTDFCDWCLEAKIELVEAAIKAVREFDNGTNQSQTRVV